MKASKILIVEDEENILDVLKLNLELEGYVLETAIDGSITHCNYEFSQFVNQEINITEYSSM